MPYGICYFYESTRHPILILPYVAVTEMDGIGMGDACGSEIAKAVATGDVACWVGAAALA